MQVTEKLARYIVALQRFKDSELGLEEEDHEIVRQLESAFPAMKEDREELEFLEWLWSDRVEQDDRVKEVRAELKKNRDFGAKVSSTTSGTMEYEKTADQLSKKLTDVKSKVRSYLLAGDVEALKEEWRLCKRIKENSHGRK